MLGRMSQNDEFCLVMSSIGNEAQAAELARALLAEGLAACVQVQAIRSFYVWQDRAQDEAECLLLIKTRACLYAALEAFIRAHHPYQTPEILRLPVTDGSADYLQWMREQTRNDAC